MNKILTIDSSTEACSVSVSNGSSIVSRFELAPRKHAELLLPMVDSVLKEANLKLSELDAIACSVGPGAFTGLRIAISVAQGLAYASQLPCIGISSLEIMAAEAFSKTDSLCCLVSIDARMNEVYFAGYSRGADDLPVANIDELVLPASAIELTEGLVRPLNAFELELSRCSIAGTGWKVYDYGDSIKELAALDPVILYPKAEMMISLAQKAFRDNCLLEASNLRPSYLRNNVAKKKSQQK